MKESALTAARPRASYDIAREIADMLFLDDGVSGGETAESDGSGLEGYGEALMAAGESGGGAAAGTGAKGGSSEERAPERIEVPA